MGTVFGRQPVIVQTFIIALVNLVALATPWDPTDALLGAINVFVAALLGMITRQVVTPLAKPKNNEGQRLVPERAAG